MQIEAIKKRAAEVTLKCLGSAVKVWLKCHQSARSQQPTATATDLPLLTPPITTVGWYKTVRLKIFEKEKMHNFFFNGVITGQL